MSHIRQTLLLFYNISSPLYIVCEKPALLQIQVLNLYINVCYLRPKGIVWTGCWFFHPPFPLTDFPAHTVSLQYSVYTKIQANLMPVLRHVLGHCACRYIYTLLPDVVLTLCPSYQAGNCLPQCWALTLWTVPSQHQHAAWYVPRTPCIYIYIRENVTYTERLG